MNTLNHVALIMDGNRRWSKQQGLSFKNGYKTAIKSIRNVIDVALEKNIPNITLFALSSDNLKRSSTEIDLLKNILKTYLRDNTQELHIKNIKISFIGNYYSFDNNIAKQIDEVQNLTNNNKALHLIIALNYSGQNDILNAVNKLILSNNEIKKITAEDISYNISTNKIPNPDILIRTGGYNRISNFMLWQLSYTELFFLDTLWPDFSKEEFIEILNKYSKVERKYGK